MTTSSERTPLLPGTVVRGKWNGRQYKLERLLGTGANGQVYLASRGRSVCALKIGTEAAELQGEANVLASIDSADRRRGRPPFLLDVDDYAADGGEVPFYVMRYVPGSPVKSYLKRHGSQWIGVIGYRLLERLGELHEAGWVFSDIKSDNVLVHEFGRVELVDYGGMTAIGRSVRQFTEVYDRGYWSAGTRTADPAYDWFAFAMLWLHAVDEKRMLQLSRTRLPQDRGIDDLMKLIRSNSKLRAMESWLERALNGQFENTQEALKEWKLAQRRSAAGDSGGGGPRVPGWMAGMLAVSVVLCVTLAAVWLSQ